MKDLLLTLNTGSSSIKFAVYEQGELSSPQLKGKLTQLSQKPQLKLEAGGETQSYPLGDRAVDTDAAVQTVFTLLKDRHLLERITAVGHRIVHGGKRFIEPCILDHTTLDQLRDLTPLAPLHQPHNLDVVDCAAQLLPDASQVGCFDTAFHAKRPINDRLYGLPRELTDQGVVAYGFHGLSYAQIATTLRTHCGDSAGGRAVVAHLGSGASLCAMAEGRSLATTMGFSALDGLVMSSRCGSLDPGVVLHLIQERGMSAEAVSELLYRQSGLLGVSGISSDMQTLLHSTDPRAGEAVDLFVYRIGRAIGSLAAAAEGIDTLVFTGGIGENAAAIRHRVGTATAWLGVKIDPQRNAEGKMRIDAKDSKVAVWIIPADEEQAIAEGVLACLDAP